MEDLAVLTALNHSGSFGKNFVKFQKNKYVIYRMRVGRTVKNYDLGLENTARGRWHGFSPYGLPIRQITYIY